MISGIYKITNTITNRFYIGQSKDIKTRFKNHLSTLRGNKHKNQFFQNDFNKTFNQLNSDSFLKLEVIEELKDSTQQQRNEREQYYINQFYDNKVNCYNIEKKVINRKSLSCHSLNPLKTKETRRQLMKKRWKDINYKSRIVSKLKESGAQESFRLKQSLKRKEIIASKLIYRGTVISPDGIEYKVFNISTFAKEHSLNRRSFNDLLIQRTKSYKNWKLKAEVL